MQCMLCKQNEATVYLTHIVGDKMQKMDLCEDCARKNKVNDSDGYSLADLLLGLGTSDEMAKAGGEEISCPNCGFTHADFKKAGRLGCSACYRTFAEGLEGVLKTMHKGTRHVGKAPVALKKSQDLSDRLKSLQKKLDRAIADENFENAAHLRDEIKMTRDQLGQMAPT